MMKRWVTVLGQFVLIAFFTSTAAFSAPNIYDGYMSYNSENDWGGLGSSTIKTFKKDFDADADLTNVSVEEEWAYGTDNYDVEELGLYIKDNVLYLGLQTQYDLSNSPDTADISAGDFIFNFDQSNDASFYGDNRDNDDFALDFTITNGQVDMILLAGDIVGTKEGMDHDNYGKDWEITSYTYSQSFENAGRFTAGNTGVDANGNYYYDYWNGQYTLEAAIDLNQLSDELSALFATYTSTSVTMYWQPSCGNDFLAARSDFNYRGTTGEPSHTPEPETMLLFGIGLLGVGAIGRNHRHKSE